MKDKAIRTGYRLLTAIVASVIPALVLRCVSKKLPEVPLLCLLVLQGLLSSLAISVAILGEWVFWAYKDSVTTQQGNRK